MLTYADVYTTGAAVPSDWTARDVVRVADACVRLQLEAVSEIEEAAVRALERLKVAFVQLPRRSLDGRGVAALAHAGAQFTFFTSTKVQILTAWTAEGSRHWCTLVLSLLVLLVQKVQTLTPAGARSCCVSIRLHTSAFVSMRTFVLVKHKY